MSAEAALLVRAFRVGKRTVTITFQKPAQGAILAAEWEPDTPRNLTRKEWRQYRAGRDEALEEYARLTGLRIALVEPR